MPRRYRRRRYALSRPVKTAKYSNETFATSFIPINNTVFNVVLSPSTTAGGTRKCKNFTLNMYTTIPGFWALVYVPEGTNPGTLNWSTPTDESVPVVSAASLYEPNQNVIMSGITRNTSESYRFKTRLARNLNSGDAVFFLFKPFGTVSSDAGGVAMSCNYAIAY